MPANVQSMAYYDEPPWHRLGRPVPKGVTAEKMIRAAGLDWEVELQPARGARKINNKGEFSRYEVVRLPRQRISKEQGSLFGTGRPPRPEVSGEQVSLGLVTRRYQPLQNAEAFSFFDSVVGDGKAYFETAGALGDGERIWVLARMPEPMEIVRGDECWRYLLLSNAHNGEGSVIVKFTPVRVVCQNTLMLAMEDGQKAYRVRHSKMMQFRLNELTEFLAITQKMFLEAGALFKRLAGVEITEARLVQYLEALFPKTESQKREGRMPPKWIRIQELLDTVDNLQWPGVKGTLWGVYNAITRFEDYKVPVQEEGPDQRLERIWFGSGSDVKLKALQKALVLSNAWLN
jgi:phage/plasmid-like protein (TIGR03299 family)